MSDPIECDICGAHAAVLRYSAEVAQVYACGACSGLFSHPAPEQNLTAIYNHSYLEDYSGRRAAQIEESKAILEMVQRFKPGGSILDYGCGAGVFLRVATTYGFTANCGADISDAAVVAARKEFGENAHTKIVNLKTGKIPTRNFDVIAFIDSIAHIKNLNTIMTELLRNNTALDGIIIIRTPRINEWQRLYMRLAAFFLPTQFVNGLYFIPQRLILFNERSLKMFLNRYGFETVMIRRAPDYYTPLRQSSIKQALRGLLAIGIPRFLNRNNSMLAIARHVTVPVEISRS